MQRNKRKRSARSVREFIKHIEGICMDNGRFLFRGQLKRDKLVPKFFRRKNGLADKSMKTEKAMLDDFTRRGRPLFNIEPQSKCEQLALAQHYGMPTRLLDWTSNAIAALWFVVTDNRLTKRGKKDGVVWVLRFNAEDKHDDIPSPFEISEPEILRPKHIEKRLVAQGGWFTIHSGEKSLNEYNNFKDNLVPIWIPYTDKRFKDMRFSLNLCGLNKVTLFPDLDGLSKHIAWQSSKEYVERRDRNIKIK